MKLIRIFPLMTVLISTPAAIRQATTSAASAMASQEQSSPPPAVRVVDLKMSDGAVLKASFFAAAKSGPGVLLLHQSNRTRKAWNELAGELAAAGINTLTLDMRGFGESGEPYTKLMEADWEKARTNSGSRP